jgi:hypothetical protein
VNPVPTKPRPNPVQLRPGTRFTYPVRNPVPYPVSPEGTGTGFGGRECPRTKINNSKPRPDGVPA